MAAQHVTFKNSSWRVIGAGNSKAIKNFDTQKKAIDFGRSIAKNQNVELVIHRKDGKIRDCDSYGKDPSRIKDTVY